MKYQFNRSIDQSFNQSINRVRHAGTVYTRSRSVLYAFCVPKSHGVQFSVRAVDSGTSIVYVRALLSNDARGRWPITSKKKTRP